MMTSLTGGWCLRLLQRACLSKMPRSHVARPGEAVEIARPIEMDLAVRPE